MPCLGHVHGANDAGRDDGGGVGIWLGREGRYGRQRRGNEEKKGQALAIHNGGEGECDKDKRCVNVAFRREWRMVLGEA